MIKVTDNKIIIDCLWLLHVFVWGWDQKSCWKVKVFLVDGDLVFVVCDYISGEGNGQIGVESGWYQAE